MKTWISRIICLLVWCCASVGLQAQTLAPQATPLEISASTHQVSLAGRLAASPAGVMLADADAALTAYRRGQFVTLAGNLGRGYQVAPTWLAFELQAVQGAPELLVLEVGPGFLDEVTAFQTNAQGQLTQLGRAGDQVPRAQVGVVAFKPSFALRVPSGSRSTVLLQVKTTSTQSAIVKLYRAAEFPSAQAIEGLLLGSIFSIHVVMLLLVLGMYATWREPISLLWLAMFVTTTGQWFMVDGLGYLYFDWTNLGNLNQLTSVFNILSLCFSMLFASVMFKFKQLNRWFFYGFNAWAALALLAFLLGSWWGYPLVVGVANKAALPAVLVGFVAIVLQMLRGHRESLWFGPLFLLYLVTVGLSVGASLGLLAYSELTFYGRQVAGFLNLLALQVGMFFRAWQLQRAYAQERSSLLSQLQQQNEVLEDEVSARTDSLSKALRSVQRAESEQRQLLSMASHEFRTPAAMIKASLDSLTYLQDSIAPEVQTRLTNMRKASERMTNLSNNLINQDRLIELALKPDKRSVDMCQLVTDVLARYPAEHQVHGQLAVTNAVIDGDAALLSIALHNLIDNALRHGHAAQVQYPPVTVSLAVQAGQLVLVLEVADCGVGIADDQKAKVFERFHIIAKNDRRATDAAATSNRPETGSGLGLSIVQSIAQAHGGQVSVRDNMPCGAVLVMQLPIAGK